jgi:Homeodomain-like domain
MVKYVVRLPTEERERLLTLVKTGRAAAAKLLHARILLKADCSVGGRHWTDAEVAEALDTSPSTVHRVRQAWVEYGLEAALARKSPTGRQYRKLDGTQEAQLIAIACSAPPAGRTRWTFKLLAEKLVALDIVDAMSAECVRSTLKKMRSNRGSTNNG